MSAIQRRPAGEPSFGSPTGKEHAYPITSERAHLVPHILACVEVHEALARGYVTLRAVAAAYYGGDIDRAKRTIYPHLTT